MRSSSRTNARSPAVLDLNNWNSSAFANTATQLITRATFEKIDAQHGFDQTVLRQRLRRRSIINKLATGQVDTPRDPGVHTPHFELARSNVMRQWQRQLACTTDQLADQFVHCIAQIRPAPYSLWCVPPKQQCVIAVGEVVKTPDAAIGDILCISDRYNRVVVRDWDGYLHRARKEKLVKPTQYERASFCVGHSPAAVQAWPDFHTRLNDHREFNFHPIYTGNAGTSRLDGQPHQGGGSQLSPVAGESPPTPDSLASRIV